jgi:hypothetical protein
MKKTKAPALPTVTIPVTFTLHHAPGWKHGNLFMCEHGFTASVGEKKLGSYNMALGNGSPIVMLNVGKDTDFSAVLAADSVEIFKAVHEAVLAMKLPKDNPLPAK